MKIVNMEMNNRHLRPKPGGYFSTANTAVVLQSPMSKPTSGFVLTKNCSSGQEESTDEKVWLVVQSEEVWLWLV